MKKDAFRQRVRLPAVQAAALKPQELSLALAYELEPFSGVPAADAEVEWTEVADQDVSVRVYDVAVRPRRSSSSKSGAGKAVATLEGLVLPACIASAAVLLAVAVDFAVLRHRRAESEAAVAELTPATVEIRRIRAEAKKTRAEADAIASSRESSAAAQERVAELRRAHADLLAVLATVCGGRSVVKSLSHDPASGGVVIKAVAASTEESRRIREDLSGESAKRGWSIALGPISSGGDGRMSEFTCTIVLPGKGGAS
ncbi:MAG: hypothetical protein K6F50_10035 [Kiritimatiellae bacterium]|nr:hypothetical protein [Kiritimatiellia bacterium]